MSSHQVLSLVVAGLVLAEFGAALAVGQELRPYPTPIVGPPRPANSAPVTGSERLSAPSLYAQPHSVPPTEVSTGPADEAGRSRDLPMSEGSGSVPSYSEEPPVRVGFWQRWMPGRKNRFRGANGCHQAECDSCPAECGPPPLPAGFLLHEHRRAIQDATRPARLVLYRYDFVDGSAELNPRGRERLTELTELLPTTFSPVFIEPDPEDSDLTERRRAAVLTHLRSAPFVVPLERVVVGTPAAPYLRGPEAELIQRRLLKQTESGGLDRQGLTPANSSSGLR